MRDEMDNPIKRGRQNKKAQSGSIIMDMNAMVDLAFLLLTFFMLTTTMLKPKAIELVMPVPDEDDDETTEVLTIKESRAITLIPMPDNELYYYQGFSEAVVEISTYGALGIRSILLDHVETTDEPIIIIKAHPESTFENLIALIDEMNITRIERYAIDQYGPKEEQLLAEAGINLK